jgi:putative ABC transport system permease protein
MSPQHWIYTVPLRLRSLFHRKRMDSELSDEIREHIDLRTQELLAKGIAPNEVRYAALREFGGITKTEQECREMRKVNWLQDFLQDIRYGMRNLRNNPGFAAIAVITLALGIGANSSLFSYVNAWVIKPLPFSDGDRLVALHSYDKKQGSTNDYVSSTGDFVDIQEQNKVFDHLVAWTQWIFDVTSDGQPERIDGGLVSWDYFEALGAQPILGRGFVQAEGQPGANHVVMISSGLWKSRFAQDPRMVGRNITMDGEQYEIVGVMPASFQFSLMGTSNLWAPLAIAPKDRNDRHTSWFRAFGKLKPGITIERAGADVAGISDHLEKLYPDTNTNQTNLLTTMAYDIGQNEGTQQVMICFALVGFILLIACANVANLMLARATQRAKEIALRSAIGASRGRLIRQLLTESLLLFLFGGIGGVFCGAWGLRWIDSVIPASVRGYLVNYGKVTLDFTTLLYTLSIALVCGLLFGLAPAFENSRIDLNRTLKEASAQSSGTKHGMRLRRIFVAAETALAVVVLVCTALLAESFTHMVHGRIGFNPQNAMVASVQVPKTRYASESEMQNFYSRVLDRIRAVPGVRAAAASTSVPFGESNTTVEIRIAGKPAAAPGETLGAQFSSVTPDYFSTMEIPLMRGRPFSEADASGSVPSVIINETLARQQFSDRDPIGQKIGIGAQDHVCVCTVVGVVGDVKQNQLNERPRRELYIPFAQSPGPYMSIVMRSAAVAGAPGNTIRDAVWAIDKTQPVSRVRLYADLIDERNAANKVLIELVAFFGFLAMFLGGIGIYGVVSQSVTQRFHEIGIRMALGGRPWQVMRMVVEGGLRLALIGVFVGLLASVAVSRILESLLYQVKTTDPLTFAGVAIVFLIVAAAASYIPARRAMRVDPIVALRHE